MFQNPFSNQKQGSFSLKSLSGTEMGTDRGLGPTLTQAIEFEFPRFEIDRERLHALFGNQINSNDERTQLIPYLITKELSKSFGHKHSLHDLEQKVSRLSGSALLSENGFIDDPRELCAEIAIRYSLILQIEMDQSILRGIFGGKGSFHLSEDHSVLTIFPKGSPKDAFTVQVFGDALEDCFRESSFLKVLRFDRSGFRALCTGALTSLDIMHHEASSTFKAFFQAYEMAYEKWMYGKGD